MICRQKGMNSEVCFWREQGALFAYMMSDKVSVAWSQPVGYTVNMWVWQTDIMLLTKTTEYTDTEIILFPFNLAGFCFIQKSYSLQVIRAVHTVTIIIMETVTITIWAPHWPTIGITSHVIMWCLENGMDSDCLSVWYRLHNCSESDTQWYCSSCRYCYSV